MQGLRNISAKDLRLLSFLFIGIVVLLGVGYVFASHRIPSSATEALVDANDVCSNFPGVQTRVPSEGTRKADGTCACPTGLGLVGDICGPTAIIQFYATPNYVEPGEDTTLYWEVQAVGAHCKVTGTDGTDEGVPKEYLESGSLRIAAIAKETTFTLSCGGVTAEEVVRLRPTIEELEKKYQLE